MKLCEIAKNLENRQVFGYKQDGNTVTAHRWTVYHATGNIWIHEPDPDEYGQVFPRICLFFPGVKIGLDLFSIGLYQFMNWEDSELISKMDFLNMGFADESDFIRAAENRMNTGSWVKNSEIAFVRQFAPAFADRMTAYHDEKSREREEKDRERIEAARKHSEEEAAERERITAEKIDAAEREIKAGREFQNETVFGKSLFNLVLDRNEIPVPIRTRGWIADRLKTVRIVPECRSVSISFWKASKTAKASQTVYELIWTLYNKLTA